ncbi:TonB-dependent receptor [Edaphobacter modestus]|uniref:Outer membrane receptor protein involved in Fe transport n=1 Tax=Edaphobacter modestus TaxID=388466 RepID=A0A4Q7YVC0_9BACT|nr:TonB-dependent receptor [Edaphobacter modestus]RZU41081.1 outer membrane receptor protein involved in Fe transport [Edaphobacter modestus]
MALRTLASLLLFVNIFAHAQLNQPAPTASGRGEIRLQITDPSGAALRARCILSGLSTSVNISTQTNAQGLWTAHDLPFGSYRLEISRNGFATERIELDIQSTAPLTRQVALKLQSVTTAVAVITPTPIGNESLSREQTPLPVQSLTAEDMRNTNALDLSDAINKRLNGVYVNENAGNPFEPDINYRGYTASPLLGTPQGLSVYLDGVRQNQPFGDVVSWDLIPKVAIQDMELIPGSNPVFGLNTLGGAIAVRTKDGSSNRGLTVQAVGGAFGRRSVEGEYGGSNGRDLDWFAAGNYFREDGWRQFSPSEVRQSFAKLRWNREKTSISLSGAYAINWLTGNGLQDFRFLKKDYTSVYSVPDTLWDHSPSLTLNANRQISDHWSLSGNLYFRHVRSDTTNGDINDESFDQSLYNLNASDITALQAAGYSGFPATGNPATEPYPYWKCIARALEKDEPSESCTGIITNTRTQQNNYGLTGLLSWRTARNLLSVGAAWDHSGLSYQQASQLGYLSSDGVSITPVDAFADGSTMQDDEPYDTRVQLHGTVNTPAFYLTDTLTLDRWSITASGRYNRTAVENIDRLPPDTPGRGSLNGSYVFQRFNPAIGATWRASSLISLYANYSEASRAPTSIELGCANPDFPCNLPNALVDDPPLHQVVSRTVEAGIRSSSQSHLSWSAGYFRGENSNDLLFVASEQTGFGYFLNFGKTRRQGVELNLSGQLPHLALGGGYTFLDATYQSPQVVNGGSNSSNDSSLDGFPGTDGDITITPGDRIPQTPQHVLKVFADYKPTSKWLIDLNIIAVSSSFARGNENNQDQPDGVYYLGSGSSPAYGVANLGARYTFNSHFEAFLQMNNLFDSHYSTAAQLGTTPYDDSGHFIARPFPPAPGSGGDYPLRNTTFLAPGAPFNIFGGLRVTFSRK